MLWIMPNARLKGKSTGWHFSAGRQIVGVLSEKVGFHSGEAKNVKNCHVGQLSQTERAYYL